MDELTELVKELLTEVKEMKNERKELIREIREFGDLWKESEKEIRGLKEENEGMKGQLRKLQDEMERRERKERENNIIIRGLQLTSKQPEELERSIRDNIKRHLDVDCKIKMAAKIGEDLLRVELESNHDKQKIMRNKRRLRNLQDSRIFINWDLTKKEREIQKQIRDHAKEEKNKGKRVLVKYQKLIVNSEMWKWDEKLGKLTLKPEIDLRGQNPKN